MAKKISWQIVVEEAGTPVQGPDIGAEVRSIAGDYFIKALPDNQGNVVVGNDGEDTIAMETGFVLQPGQMIVWNGVNLAELWFDASESGDGFCLFKQ